MPLIAGYYGTVNSKLVENTKFLIVEHFLLNQWFNYYYYYYWENVNIFRFRSQFHSNQDAIIGTINFNGIDKRLENYTRWLGLNNKMTNWVTWWLAQELVQWYGDLIKDFVGVDVFQCLNSLEVEPSFHTLSEKPINNISKSRVIIR